MTSLFSSCANYAQILSSQPNLPNAETAQHPPTEPLQQGSFFVVRRGRQLDHAGDLVDQLHRKAFLQRAKHDLLDQAAYDIQGFGLYLGISKGCLKLFDIAQIWFKPQAVSGRGSCQTLFRRS